GMKKMMLLLLILVLLAVAVDARSYTSYREEIDGLAQKAVNTGEVPVADLSSLRSRINGDADITFDEKAALVKKVDNVLKEKSSFPIWLAVAFPIAILVIVFIILLLRRKGLIPGVDPDELPGQINRIGRLESGLGRLLERKVRSYHKLFTFTKTVVGLDNNLEALSDSEESLDAGSACDKPEELPISVRLRLDMLNIAVQPDQYWLYNNESDHDTKKEYLQKFKDQMQENIAKRKRSDPSLRYMRDSLKGINMDLILPGILRDINIVTKELSRTGKKPCKRNICEAIVKSSMSKKVETLIKVIRSIEKSHKVQNKELKKFTMLEQHEVVFFKHFFRNLKVDEASLKQMMESVGRTGMRTAGNRTEKVRIDDAELRIKVQELVSMFAELDKLFSEYNRLVEKPPALLNKVGGTASLYRKTSLDDDGRSLRRRYREDISRYLLALRGLIKTEADIYSKMSGICVINEMNDVCRNHGIVTVLPDQDASEADNLVRRITDLLMKIKELENKLQRDRALNARTAKSSGGEVEVPMFKILSNHVAVELRKKKRFGKDYLRVDTDDNIFITRSATISPTEKKDGYIYVKTPSIEADIPITLEKGQVYWGNQLLKDGDIRELDRLQLQFKMMKITKARQEEHEWARIEVLPK
ncbi:MAG: hypothetical protein ACE5DM_01950, partial [Candidatus Nanoarchaeia archaeon]